MRLDIDQFWFDLFPNERLELPVEKPDQSHVTRFIMFGVWGDGGFYAVTAVTRE